MGIVLGATRIALGTPECPADVDGSGTVNSGDISAYLTAWLDLVNSGGCPAPPQPCPEDFSGDGLINSADISAFLTVWLSAINAGGCPSSIEVSITPTSASLGKLITLTISPASPPNVIDSTTTASWTGRYVPMVGSPTSVFSIEFSATDVRELSESQAQIIFGSGSGSLPSGIADLGPGSFQGAMALQLGSGAIVSGVVNISPATSAGVFERVLYPDGIGGLDPPQRNGPLTELPIARLSLTQPNPSSPPTEALLAATDAHLAIVILVAENAATLAVAPASVVVDIVSYSASGSEVTRLSNVTLSRLASDGDPNHLVYQSDLNSPIMLVDTALDPSQYPGLRVLFAPGDGSAAIVPASQP